MYCRGTLPKANTKDTGIFRERNHGVRRNAEAVLRYEQRITIDFLLQRLTQKPATQSTLRSYHVSCIIYYCIIIIIINTAVDLYTLFIIIYSTENNMLSVAVPKMFYFVVAARTILYQVI